MPTIPIIPLMPLHCPALDRTALHCTALNLPAPSLLLSPSKINMCCTLIIQSMVLTNISMNISHARWSRAYLQTPLSLIIKTLIHPLGKYIQNTFTQEP